MGTFRLDNESTYSTLVPDLDSIFIALGVMPEFNNNLNVITIFKTNNCDQLTAIYIANKLDHLRLTNRILNCITGHAARTLTTNGLVES